MSVWVNVLPCKWRSEMGSDQLCNIPWQFSVQECWEQVPRHSFQSLPTGQSLFNQSCFHVVSTKKMQCDYILINVKNWLVLQKVITTREFSCFFHPTFDLKPMTWWHWFDIDVTLVDNKSKIYVEQTSVPSGYLPNTWVLCVRHPWLLFLHLPLTIWVMSAA